jgi:hypothetical protein
MEAIYITLMLDQNEAVKEHNAFDFGRNMRMITFDKNKRI